MIQNFVCLIDINLFVCELQIREKGFIFYNRAIRPFRPTESV
jgi:hypothetical protein